jgi:hypothetical protein
VIEAMPRPRPPHLQRQVTRHGKVAWYVRIGRGTKVRVRAEFGTPEFDAEYQAALAGTQRPQKGDPQAGTLAWLIARYRETGAWSNELALATRRQRENIFKQVIAAAGDKPFVRITTQVIIAGVERRKDTPAQARHFLDTLRGLFRWAVKAKIAKIDPTAGIENPQKKKTRGLSGMDGGRSCSLRAALAHRHQGAGVVRRFALHRAAARRCGCRRTPAFARWHCDVTH